MYLNPEVKGGRTFTQDPCKFPLADENTCTPVADPDVPSAVTETNTVPVLETMASKGLPAVAKSVEAEVTIGVEPGGGLLSVETLSNPSTRETPRTSKVDRCRKTVNRPFHKATS